MVSQYPCTKINDLEELNEALSSNQFVMLDFYADWCGPCKVFDKQIKIASAKYQNLKIIKIDIDEADEISDEYEVENLPTALFFHNGDKKSLFMGSKFDLFHKKVDDLMAS